MLNACKTITYGGGKNPRTLDLKPLADEPVQPYFSNRVQLAEIIEWVLSQTGQADIDISTFSTSEEFLRRLAVMQRKGMARKCRLFADLRAARKTVVLYDFMKSVFESVHLCENHSKVVLLSNDDWRVAIVTSQNQTRGDRIEGGIVAAVDSVFYKLLLGFDAMKLNSISIDDLNSRTN